MNILITGATGSVGYDLVNYLSKNHNDGYANSASEKYTNPFIVFFRYKSQLSGFQKKFFDPFCRRSRINFYFNDDIDNPIVTTVGQLNFFKWAIENHIISFLSPIFHKFFLCHYYFLNL